MLSKFFPTKERDETDPNGTMIIVDDEKIAHQTLSLMIRGINYAPVSAYSMKDVKASFAQAEQPTVVFLDVYMPGVDTLNILTYCKEKDPDIHVVIITGSNNLNMISTYIGAGADDFLLKPFNRKMFMAKAKLALMRQNKELSKPCSDEKIADEKSTDHSQGKYSSMIEVKDKEIQQLQSKLKKALAENDLLQKELSNRPLQAPENIVDEDIRILIKEAYDKLNSSNKHKQAIDAKFAHDINNVLFGLNTLQELTSE